MKKKGFTLIELLVVIAIISLLSSVILASLESARSKGKNAAVQEDLNNIRSQAELIYNSTNSYTTVCTNAYVTNMYTAAGTAGGGSGGLCNSTCSSPSTSWAAEAQLSVQQGSFVYWCIDNLGNGRGEASALGALCNCQ